MRQVVVSSRRRAAESTPWPSSTTGSRARAAVARHAASSPMPGRPAAPRTVLLQADNSWRTVAATLAVGMSGGVLARGQPAHHQRRVRRGLRGHPARRRASPNRRRTGGVGRGHPARPGSRRPASTAGRLGWPGGNGRRRRALGRWRADRPDLGLDRTRPRASCRPRRPCATPARAPSRSTGLRPGDAVAAIVPLSSAAAYCFGVYLALPLGGPLVPSLRWDPAALLARLALPGSAGPCACRPWRCRLGAAAAERGFTRAACARSPSAAAPWTRPPSPVPRQSLGTRILRVFGMSECLGHTSP